MVPPKITYRVPIGVYKAFADAKNIPSKISGKEYIVILIYFPIEFCVQIIEIGGVINIKERKE